MNDIHNPPASVGHETGPLLVDASKSPLSWSAILAGGVAAAAFSLILLTLGVGMGLGTLSPWAPAHESAVRFGLAAVVWVCVTEVLTSGLGGYLAGRLRRRWVAVHGDETYFRDTAHGFLSWAVATIVSASLLALGVAGLVNAGARVAAESASRTDALMKVARGDAEAAAKVWPIGYFVDALFRVPANSPIAMPISGSEKAERDEVTRIFLNSLPANVSLSADDARYASQLVVQRTGISLDAAQVRVNTTYSRLQQKLNDLAVAAKSSAEKARKSAIFASLWLFVSLLMGAFSASLMATFGGRHRDL